MAIVVGAPVPYAGRLYNCSVVICEGRIAGIVPKIHLSNEDKRIFASGCDFQNSAKDFEIRYAGQKCPVSPDLQFRIGAAVFAVETTPLLAVSKKLDTKGLICFPLTVMLRPVTTVSLPSYFVYISPSNE